MQKAIYFLITVCSFVFAQKSVFVDVQGGALIPMATYKSDFDARDRFKLNPGVGVYVSAYKDDILNSSELTHRFGLGFHYNRVSGDNANSGLTRTYTASGIDFITQIILRDREASALTLSLAPGFQHISAPGYDSGAEIDFGLPEIIFNVGMTMEYYRQLSPEMKVYLTSGIGIGFSRTETSYPWSLGWRLGMGLEFGL